MDCYYTVKLFVRYTIIIGHDKLVFQHTTVTTQFENTKLKNIGIIYKSIFVAFYKWIMLTRADKRKYLQSVNILGNCLQGFRQAVQSWD